MGTQPFTGGMQTKRRSFDTLCDFCHKRMEAPGAIFYSPPYSDDTVRRFDACPTCFDWMIRAGGKGK